jgi:crossover junction endodeoxyribonuclease RuvC
MTSAPTLFTSEVPAATTAAGTRPRVLGLDLSLSGTGIASSLGWCRAVGYTDSKNPITKLPHTRRLNAMRAVRDGIIHEIGSPALAVLELPAPSRSGGGAHERAWLWWEIYGHLVAHDIPVGLVSINQLKLYATGKGNADKKVVVDQVARRWPQWETLGNDNCADAVALMAAGLDWLGERLAVVPVRNWQALENCQWPDREAVTAS